MCIPVAAVGLAIGAASSVLGYVQQSQQAKAETRAIKDNYAQRTEALKLQYDQTNKQAIDQMSARAREAMIESARLRAFSGESGLMGIANDRIQAESQFNLGTDIASIESNRQSSVRQLYQEGKEVRANAVSKINGITRPSLIGTGLQIAGTAVNAAGNYQAAKNKLPAYVTG